MPTGMVPSGSGAREEEDCSSEMATKGARLVAWNGSDTFKFATLRADYTSCVFVRSSLPRSR